MTTTNPHPIARATGQRIVCAWCDLVLLEGPGATSHGICPECADAIEREAVDKPRGDDQDEASNPRWDVAP